MTCKFADLTEQQRNQAFDRWRAFHRNPYLSRLEFWQIAAGLDWDPQTGQPA